jgi:hypothetical protein
LSFEQTEREIYQPVRQTQAFFCNFLGTAIPPAGDMVFTQKNLEHFHKSCSHADEEVKAAVLLGFGFVFAQSEAATDILLRSSLAKTQNSALPHGYSFSSNALAIDA